MDQDGVCYTEATKFYYTRPFSDIDGSLLMFAAPALRGGNLLQQCQKLTTSILPSN